MAFLSVALLSIIAHLALGQGWGQSNSRLSQGNAGLGFGQVGASWGQAGLGQSNAGLGLGQTGASLGQAGLGLGSPGPGFGTRGHGFGTRGLGIGRTSWGQAGTGWGQNIINPYLNTTITCTGTATGFAMSLTLRRMQPTWGGWGIGQSRSGLTGSAVLRTTTVSGTYNLVITERSRVEAGCTADGLGPVLGSNVWGQQWGQGLGQQWGQPWGQQWGQGLGQSWGTGTTTTPGVVTSVTLTTNQETVIDLGSANLPFRQIERYGGRGMALCTSLTTGTDGRQVCVEPILACCKLGFDNMDAVTPTPP